MIICKHILLWILGKIRVLFQYIYVVPAGKKKEKRGGGGRVWVSHFIFYLKWLENHYSITTISIGYFLRFCGVLYSLDTFPYAGTTTTCESLYMGVPCVTMAGSVHAHNVGVSILQNIGK